MQKLAFQKHKNNIRNNKFRPKTNKIFNKDLKYLVKESQTPRGLNEQAVKELRKAGFYRSTEKTLNNILKRLNKV